MLNGRSLMEVINSEFEKLRGNLDLIDFDDFKRLEEHIKRSNRIFITGKGRSSFVGMMFAMRLLQKGYKVYFISIEMTDLIPPIEEGDLLIAISGSGETTEVITVAKATKELKGTIVAITSWEDSSLGKIADETIKIVGREKSQEQSFVGREVKGTQEPPGAYFEILSTIVLESLATLIEPKQ
ncbi:MAG: SIS domain-containing protein [Candidatus Jordarchaeum sp.]|uniref:SIS domain-containing protein n=1 Tax=Candidatus Jordarchaeum sp. TaxID=2823881 RepID=UPI00404AB994